MTEPTPLPPDDAAAFHNAKLDALALIEASIEARGADLQTIIEPHLRQPYWMFNALLTMCNSLILANPDPRGLVDQLRAELINTENPEGTDK